MSKFKTDLERLETVKAYKLSHMTVSAYARKINMSRDTLKDWVNAYDNIGGDFVRINKVLNRPNIVLEDRDIKMNMLSAEDIIKKSTHFSRFDHSVVVIEIGKIKVTTSLEQALKIMEQYYVRFK